ncbi:MAG: shikimate kinase [candidate division KSB1 bacterium]|nr:shikimate kinase [candidate division KSB1 bacterium]MDZ7365188.1 shikimate kinase [candidate division KSB1 bacterium]MDZ7404398.1 shikimate kinase [candidate division KSB1 bacterium]
MTGTANKIFLLGFMGCGKSTIGRLLAAQLKWNFIDLDEQIVAQQQMSIEQIFAMHGEPYFRQVELALLEQMRGFDNVVIALGGGTAAQEAAWTILKQDMTIYLRCHPDELFRRLKDDPHRPMLGHMPATERLQVIKNLLALREPFYSRADFTVDSFAEHPPAETAAIVAHLIRDHLLNTNEIENLKSSI